MANRAKVDITAEYTDRVSRQTRPTMRALESLENQVRTLAGAWGIAEIARFTLESSKLAAQNEITAKSFERLAINAGTTATEELNKMRAAVGGTLSDLELMQKVGAAVDAALTFDQSRIALEFLRRYSVAFGKDFQQLTSTIFTGLQRGSTLMLDDAGIIIDASSSIYNGLNEVEKKSALVGDAIQQMQLKMNTLPEITSNAVTEADRLTVAYQNLKIAIGEVANNAQFVSFLQILTKGAEFAAQPVGQEFGLTASDYGKGAVDFFKFLGLEEDVVLGGFFKEMREKVDQQITQTNKINELEAERQKRLQEERAEIQKTIQATKERPARLRAEAEALEKSNEALRQRQEQLDKYAAAQRAWQNDIFGDLGPQRFERGPGQSFIEDDNLRLRQEMQFLDQITLAEAQASDDRIAIIEAEHEIRVREAVATAIEIGATWKELDRYLAALEAQRAQREKAERERREQQAREQEVRQVLLVFTADASQVKSESDLAAYSLGLFVESLSRVSPAIATVVSGIEQVATGYASGGVVGGLASGAGFALSTSMAHFAADAAKWRAEVENLSRELEDARDITGAYASEVANLSVLQQEQQFRDTISSLPEQLGRGFNEVNWAHFVDFENFTTAGVNEIENVIAQLTQAFSNSYSNDYLTAQGLIVLNAFANLEQLGNGIKRFSGETFTFAQAMDDFRYAVRIDDIEDPTQKLTALSDSLKQIGVTIDESGIVSGADLLSLQQQRTLNLTIKDIQEEVTRADIDAREQQANVLISAIEEQAKDVENALIDAQEASKRAVLRSVSTIFDIQEIALRQSFVPQLIGARTDPIETARVIAEANREIELLRLSEEAATTARLAELRETFESTQKENYEISQLQIEAIHAASENTSLAFSDALALEMGGLSGDFNTFLDLAHSATTEEIVGSLNTSRFAMLDKLDTVSVNNTSDLKATAGAITISVDAAAQKITGSISAIHVPDPNIPDYGDPQWNVIRGSLDYLQDIRDFTWATQNHLYDMLQDQRNASPGQVLNLTSTNDILTTIRAYGWATQHHLFDIATDGLDRVVSAIHSPLWAQSGVPNSGTSNNRSGGGDLVLQININIESVSGTVDANDARDLFKDHLEDLITESMTDGEIRQALNQYMGYVVRQSIPSTIRT